jgi:hypothetical protein
MVSHLKHVGPFLLLLLALTSLAWNLNRASGQDQAVGGSNGPSAETSGEPVQNVGVVPGYIKPQAHQRQHRRSIVHHYSYPYPGYYYGDDYAGFRNPGGVGRSAEYYPPGNRFQVERDPVQAARFDQGGGAPDRAEQLAAQSIGIARANSIQGHIDRYAMPYFGYGFGVGGFGGFW